MRNPWEQLEGKEADARSDIFSFGAMLYEMITGRKGFEGSSHASLIVAVMSVNPPPVSTIQPMASPALDRVVRKCLAKSRTTAGRAPATCSASSNG